MPGSKRPALRQIPDDENRTVHNRTPIRPQAAQRQPGVKAGIAMPRHHSGHRDRHPPLLPRPHFLRLLHRGAKMVRVIAGGCVTRLILPRPMDWAAGGMRPFAGASPAPTTLSFPHLLQLVDATDCVSRRRYLPLLHPRPARPHSRTSCSRTASPHGAGGGANRVA